MTCRRLAGDMPNPPAIENAGSKAFYSSITDRVTMPPRTVFISAEEYHATLLRELTHSTGHGKRLARENITEAAAFGSATYSKEELIAEMGALISAPKPESRTRSSKIRLRMSPAGWRNGDLAITPVISRHT